MKFLINEHEADIAVQGRSVGAVLAEMDERAESAGLIIIEVRANGAVCTLKEIEALAEGNAEDAGSVQLIAVPALDLKAAALENIIRCITSQCPSLRDGSPEEAEPLWTETIQSYEGLLSADEISLVNSFTEKLSAGAADTEESARKIIHVLNERRCEITEAAEAMQSAARLFDTLQADMSEVPVRLQTGRDKEALQTIVLVIELISKTARILPAYMRLNPNAQQVLADGTSAEKFYTDLNSILAEMVSAFETKDTVLIGDLVEYEIRPRLAAFFGMVRA